jgi:hypothetical protein
MKKHLLKKVNLGLNLEPTRKNYLAIDRGEPNPKPGPEEEAMGRLWNKSNLSEGSTVSREGQVLRSGKSTRADHKILSAREPLAKTQ